MMSQTATARPAPLPGASDLFTRYRAVRDYSLTLLAPLEVEDTVIQTMPDVSPTKWHLAHVTWFFESFILGPRGVAPVNADYHFLFNSYYVSKGERHARPQRGLLSRPTLAEVLRYREQVDARMQQLLAANPDDAELASLVELGLQHEQQHQELLLMDIKHVLSCNPLRPAYRPAPATTTTDAIALDWLEHPAGLARIGRAIDAPGFAYDNETPQHRCYLDRYALANRPVTNGEYRDFIDDGGYARADLWLSDGWDRIQRDGWQAPLYWEQRDGQWWRFTLHGMQPLQPAAPVCHLSFYEAEAYAQWAGARLPTEAEWEVAAADQPLSGQYGDPLRPEPDAATAGDGLRQWFGGVWEWTRSAYAPYPGFRPLPGSLGEYNGKFMVGQYVMRGGASVSSPGHLRASYRNFFYPQMRWQFGGLRLAR